MAQFVLLPALLVNSNNQTVMAVGLAYLPAQISTLSTFQLENRNVFLLAHLCLESISIQQQYRDASQTALASKLTSTNMCKHARLIVAHGLLTTQTRSA